MVTRRVCRLSLSGMYTSCRSEGGDREDHVDDLVLGLGRDLFGLLGGLGGLCAHVGTLGETAELCHTLVSVDLQVY